MNFINKKINERYYFIIWYYEIYKWIYINKVS